jgi:ABC-2 type transport system permease protein
MRTIKFILQKEFLQIFRNRAMLPIIFVLPIVQLLVLAHAATFEVHDTAIAVIDHDGSTTSRHLIEKLQATGYFAVDRFTQSEHEADRAMMAGDVRMILEIPSDFERSLQLERRASLQMIFNAEDGAAAGVVQAYAQQVIAGFNKDIQVKFSTNQTMELPASRVEAVPAFWYNPELEYKNYMVPGILVILVTVVGTFLSSMNVVREKEIGTIEQLNVTPIRKREFIIGKLVPFWIIAMFELAFGLTLARIVFNIPIVGDLWLVFALAAVYMLVMLGIGLWISTITETQQQAMFVAWFIVVIFILMSGLFTPIESMPKWAQMITEFNPIAHFIEIMRRVLLKGAGFEAVQKQFWILAGYAVAMLSLAVTQYRKVVS